MKRLLSILIGLSFVVSIIVPVKAEEAQDKNVISIEEASEDLLQELNENNVYYNSTTKISVVEVKNNQNPAEKSTALSVVTIADGVVEQYVISKFDESGSVIPVKLMKKDGTKGNLGQYTGVDTQSNTIFVGTTRSVYALYVDNNYCQYIRPISAGFSYHYNTGYSGTFNGTYTFYTYGPKFSYPSFSLLSESSGHIITVSRNNAVQNVTYTNTDPLPYGECIGIAIFEVSIPIWGLFSGTANGVYFEWYMNALNYGA